MRICNVDGNRGQLSSLLLTEIGQDELKLIKRAKFECSCCGFKSKPTSIYMTGGMQVLSYDGAKQVFCGLCAGVISIGRPIAGVREWGKLIYAPDIPQQELNKLMMNLIHLTSPKHADKYPPELVNKANKLYRQLHSDEMFANGTHNPIFDGTNGGIHYLAEFLEFCDPEIKAIIPELVEDIRLIPDKKYFTQLINFYYHVSPESFLGQ